jgi:hypothetical protein
MAVLILVVMWADMAVLTFAATGVDMVVATFTAISTGIISARILDSSSDRRCGRGTTPGHPTITALIIIRPPSRCRLRHRSISSAGNRMIGTTARPPKAITPM